jgi:hypothetical protein
MEGRLGRGIVRAVVGAVAVAAALLAAAPASAADPGRWDVVDRASIPFVYFQGMTSAPNGDLFFDGISVGLYRTDSQLFEQRAVANAIPPAVGTAESFNHIGDLTYASGGAEGDRVLLPLECYYPGTPSGANTCGNGAIGVADPETLAWRYYVRLDNGPIKKAMWAEVTPDGSELWTQGAGQDLLVYDMADITAANAWTPGTNDPSSPKLIDPIRTYDDALPTNTATGATFYRGRLYVAGQVKRNGEPSDLFHVWSLPMNDPGNTAAQRVEIERELSGESEGLDVFGSLGGILHWQIQPIPQGTGQRATYDNGGGSILSFVPSTAPAADDIRDRDDDGVADADDQCPDEPGGNNADGCKDPTSPADGDGDGVLDTADNCDGAANNFQANADQDAEGDACDTDDDGDGVQDVADDCRFRTDPGQLDTDGDGIGDACEDDDDNDTLVDWRDNCPAVANPGQEDTDDDGIGDACEPAEPPADAVPPQTTIGKKDIDRRARRATFVFSSSELGGRFRCILDGRRRKRCDSPRVFRHLKRGRHLFAVAAIDAAGNVDPTPAEKRFRIPKHKRGHGHRHG